MHEEKENHVVWLLHGAWIQFLLTMWESEGGKPEAFVVQKRERLLGVKQKLSKYEVRLSKPLP